MGHLTFALIVSVLLASQISTAQEKVIVVGAGISGLSAAKDLKEAGYEIVVLEARDRIGGRIWTDRSTGTNLDLGASWIHGIDDNPIKALADQINTPLTRLTDYDNTSTFDADGTEDPVDESLTDDFQSAYNQYAAPHLEEGDDISVQAVIDEAVTDGAYSGLGTRIIDSLVNTTFEHELSGGAADLSIGGPEEGEDTTGGDVLFSDGYDNITNYLATGLDIRLQAVVQKVTYSDSGAVVDTSQGVFTGDRVIVTVPLGVLKAGDITFDPSLPDEKLSAIERLGFGVLNKVWLAFPTVFWDNADIHNYFSEPKGHFNEWVNWQKHSGQRYLLGFNAAAYGVEIEGKTDDAIVSEAMSILRLMWGNDIPDPTSHVITRWNSDIYAKGSYSYIKVGSVPADRALLAKSVSDRLFFAGEATDTSHAATTNGAYNSGILEAAKIVAIGNLDSDGDGVRDLDDAFPQDNTKSQNQLTSFQYLQTTSSSANITSIHIVNSSSSTQSFTGTLYDGGGALLGATNTALSTESVPANARLILSSDDIEILFGTSAWSGPAMLEVTGTDDFELMAKLISPSGLVSNTNCVRQDRVLNIEPYSSTNETFIRFINTTDNVMGEIRGTMYDTDGVAIGPGNLKLLDSLSPKQAVWITKQQFASLMGVEWQSVAMLEVDTLPGLKLLNLNLVNGETFFNFFCFESSDSARMYIQTTSSSNNVSFTHLVNTSDAPQQFTGTLFNGDGEQLGSANKPLHTDPVPAKGRVVLSSTDLETAFSASAWSGPAMIEVQGSDSFEIMTKLTSPSGLISNTNCVRRNQVHNVEPPGSSDQTFVRLINSGTTTMTNITGNLYNQDGNLIGSENNVLSASLAPKAAVWLTQAGLSSIVGDNWNGAALLKINSPPDDLRLLNLSLINNETFFNFSCYEAAN